MLLLVDGVQMGELLDICLICFILFLGIQCKFVEFGGDGEIVVFNWSNGLLLVVFILIGLLLDFCIGFYIEFVYVDGLIVGGGMDGIVIVIQVGYILVGQVGIVNLILKNVSVICCVVFGYING